MKPEKPDLIEQARRPLGELPKPSVESDALTAEQTHGLIELFTQRIVDIARSESADQRLTRNASMFIWEYFARRSDREWHLRAALIGTTAKQLMRRSDLDSAGAAAEIGRVVDLLRRYGFIDQQRTSADFLALDPKRPARPPAALARCIDSRFWTGGESLGVVLAHRPPGVQTAVRVADGRPAAPVLDSAATELFDRAFGSLCRVRSGSLDVLRLPGGRCGAESPWDDAEGCYAGLLASGRIDHTDGRLEYRWRVPTGEAEVLRAAGQSLLPAAELLAYDLAGLWPMEHASEPRGPAMSRWQVLDLRPDPLAVLAAAVLAWGGEVPAERLPRWHIDRSAAMVSPARVRCIEAAAERFNAVGLAAAMELCGF